MEELPPLPEIEDKQRKLVHIAAGLLALLLRYLRPWQAVGLAVAGIAFNAFVLPRWTGNRLFRQADWARGYSPGILLYPVSILILLLVFPNRPEIVAATWAILAFGDGMGGLTGQWIGGRRLGWNRNKTIVGSLAFLLFGTMGSAFLFLFVQTGSSVPAINSALVLLFCFLATGCCALVESLPLPIDDNLSVPFTGAAVLFFLTAIDPSIFREEGWSFLATALLAAAVNGLLAYLFLTRGWVDRSGAASGFWIGVLMFTFGGWRGFLLLLLFFALGTGATRLGYRDKEARGIAQEGKGARSTRHAVANCGLATFLFLIAALAPALRPWLWLGAVAALATAAFDTVSSEIGQLFPRWTVLVTTLRSAPAGTEGAVSPMGTAAGIAAAGIVSLLALAINLLDRPAAAGIVLAAGFVGGMAESFLGATLGKSRLLGNESLNFLNTLIGAMFAVLIGSWIL